MSRFLSLLSDFTTSVNRSIDFRIGHAIKSLYTHLREPPGEFPSHALAPAGISLPPELPARPESGQRTKQLLDDLFGTLFAVPKKRVTVWVRKQRRQGAPQWAPHGSKLLEPKRNIVACQTCGHYKELQYLCEKCYQRVKEASKVVQEAIVKEFSEQPVDREVQVRYRGETADPSGSDVRCVEVDQERPEWFSPNLLSKPYRTALPAQPSAPQEIDQTK